MTKAERALQFECDNWELVEDNFGLGNNLDHLSDAWLF